MTNEPREFYSANITKHQQALELLQKKRTRLGWQRLIVFLLTIAATYYVFVSFGLWGIIALCTGIGILLFLVSKDVNNNQSIAHRKKLIGISKDELRFLDHDFKHAYDGAVFNPSLHDYSNDLDLFGKASLFQYVNRAYTEQGRERLANNLLRPLELPTIKQRHEACNELSSLTTWREEFQALAMLHPLSTKTALETSRWMKEEQQHFKSKAWPVFIFIYSAITLGSALAAILGYIPGPIFIFLFGLYFTTAIILSRNTIKPYIQLGGIVKEISTMQRMVEWIEQPSFKSHYINKLRNEAAPGNEKASDQIKELRSILDKFDLRLSIVGLLFFNSFLLWDIRQMLALNKWREKNRSTISQWFVLVAEMEVLNSLATLQYNHPQWCVPNFTEKHFHFDARELGHPLIAADKRVSSDFKMEGPPKIGLITGSNMAGKSTFLRSLGVNMVLAQAGAVVCAKTFECTPVKIMSSMRIADDLSENTSTFYAELKKLKTIIEAVNRKEEVFILLDEILRGTNSYDRHLGSAALIEQVIRENAVAVLATHDVELASLKDKFTGEIENYHFDVQVEGEELFFDYKLKNGVCQSLNASILMKKIGIRLGEEGRKV